MRSMVDYVRRRASNDKPRPHDSPRILPSLATYASVWNSDRCVLPRFSRRNSGTFTQGDPPWGIPQGDPPGGSPKGNPLGDPPGGIPRGNSPCGKIPLPRFRGFDRKGIRSFRGRPDFVVRWPGFDGSLYSRGLRTQICPPLALGILLLPKGKAHKMAPKFSKKRGNPSPWIRQFVDKQKWFRALR